MARPTLPGGAAGATPTLSAARPGVGDTAHLHEIRGPRLLPDGLHELQELTGDAYKWFITQTLGSALPPAVLDLVKNREILREFGTRFYIKDGRYIIFRGSPQLRRYLTGTRYRVDHPRVIVLTGGGASGLTTGLKYAARGQALGILVVGGIDIIQGIAEDQSAGEILVEVMGDAVKALISAAITTGILAGLAMFATAPVGVVVIGGIVLSATIGGILDLADSELGISAELQHRSGSAGAWLEAQYSEQVRQPIMRLLAELEDSIQVMYGNPVSL